MNISAISEKIKAALVDEDTESKHVDDIAFHLTDWVCDLQELVSFYEAPNEYDSSQVREILTHFLVHAPNHLAAAAKLMLDYPISDVFGVGAVRASKDGDNKDEQDVN